MSKRKTWVDLHEDEKFGCGGGNENYPQCKDCLYQSDGTIASNYHFKCCCAIYSYPGHKPHEFFRGEVECEDYEQATEEDLKFIRKKQANSESTPRPDYKSPHER